MPTLHNHYSENISNNSDKAVFTIKSLESSNEDRVASFQDLRRQEAESPPDLNHLATCHSQLVT